MYTNLNFPSAQNYVFLLLLLLCVCLGVFVTTKTLREKKINQLCSSRVTCARYKEIFFCYFYSINHRFLLKLHISSIKELLYFIFL